MARHVRADQATASVDAGAEIWKGILASPGGAEPASEEDMAGLPSGVSDAPRRERRVPQERRSRQARPTREEEARERAQRQPRSETGKFRRDEEELDAEELEDDDGLEASEEDLDDEEWDEDPDPDGGVGTDHEELRELLAGTKHRVTADGQDLEVDYEELINGYSRTQYLTRRTQEAAAREREAEGMLQSLTAERQKYQVLTARLAERVQEQVANARPDPALQETNPVQYLVQMNLYREKQAELEALQREQVRTQDANNAAMANLRKAALAREYELLLDAVPEWKNAEDGGHAERMELFTFAQEAYGWTPEDLEGVTDHRLILLLRDAEVGRKARSTVKPVKRRRPGTARPGSGNTAIKRSRTKRRSRDQLRQAAARVRETGSKKDGVAAVKAYLSRQSN